MYLVLSVHISTEQDPASTSSSRRSSHLRREASARRDTSVYDVGVDNGTTYIASERVSGETETVTANWTREGEEARGVHVDLPIESAQP